MTALEFQAPAANVSFLLKRRAALNLALGARHFWRTAGLSLKRSKLADVRPAGIAWRGRPWVRVEQTLVFLGQLEQADLT